MAAGDAAIGSQIYVSIATSVDNQSALLGQAGGGEFDFDTVTLSFVPEPAVLALMTLPAVLMLRRRGRFESSRR